MNRRAGSVNWNSASGTNTLPSLGALTDASQSSLQAGGRCEWLEWDTTFFGRRIARYVGSTYSATEADAARRFCAAHEIDCLYLALDAADVEAAGRAQEFGGRLVGVRVTLEARLPRARPHTQPPGAIRKADDRDVPRLRAIARQSHQGTRFYADPEFDNERCDALYDTWIEKSCQGAADVVFVAERAGEPVAYITCHRDSRESGRIGLVAVAAAARSCGIGTRLVGTALQWFTSERVQVARVSTYAHDGSALRLYERSGFVTRSVQTWFHLWKPRA